MDVQEYVKTFKKGRIRAYGIAALGKEQQCFDLARDRRFDVYSL